MCACVPCGQTVGRCNNSFFTPDKQLFATSPIGAAAYLFDGVAAIALAADAALNASKEQDAPTLGPMLLEELLRVSFDGASGPVSLNAQGDRDPATIQFALRSFALEGTNFTYYYNISSTGVFGRTAVQWIGAGEGQVQWIGGGKGPEGQPPDAYTSKVCVDSCCPPPQLPEAPSLDPLRKQRLHAHPLLARKWQLLAQAEKREANKREAARRMVVGTIVGILMVIVATLGPAIWLVRVRRVAALYLTVTGQTVTGRSSNLTPTEQQIG